jgi:hypothetical protein
LDPVKLIALPSLGHVVEVLRVVGVVAILDHEQSSAKWRFRSTFVTPMPSVMLTPWILSSTSRKGRPGRWTVVPGIANSSEPRPEAIR